MPDRHATVGEATAEAPVVLTERLLLSALTEADAPALLAYRADPDVGRYQSWEPRTPDDARAFIARLHGVRFDTPGTWFQFGLRLRDGGALVGDLGVHVPEDEPQQAEVGITLAPAHQGSGFATEALTAMLGHLFGNAGKHRVFASVDPRNTASVALMKRVGMRQEAHLRESMYLKDEWVDDLIFATLGSEWRSR